MNYQLLYQILSTINQSRTISQVANQLYLSQPYISQVISKSEKKYQVKLVNRSSLPIELTKAGKQLLVLGNSCCNSFNTGLTKFEIQIGVSAIRILLLLSSR